MGKEQFYFDFTGFSLNLKLYLILLFLIMATTASTAQQVIPEWNQPKGLVLVYPKGLPEGRTNLTACYQQLIRQVLSSTELPELTLVVRPSAKKELDTFLQTLQTSTKVRIFETKTIQDIWARDFCPIFFTGNTVCKAYYNPSYFHEKHLKYADLDDQVGLELANILNLKVNYFIEPSKENLIFDGGNFVTNGHGSAIVTNRVISDNESLSIDQIKNIFRASLGISNLILVPVEPGDATGHIDGMVRFIDDQTVLISAYPAKYSVEADNISEKDYKSSKQFLDKLAIELSKDFKVVRLESAVPKETSKFPSAFGNYINFLRLGDTVFLPQYGIGQDKKAIETFATHFPNISVIPVHKDIDKLSSFGGVLNCISWTYY